MKKGYKRLTQPLVRDNGDNGDRGSLRPASWDEALERAANGFKKHKGTSFGLFSCSKSTNEMNFMAQKFARVVMGSNNIDSWNRT